MVLCLLLMRMIYFFLRILLKEGNLDKLMILEIELMDEILLILWYKKRWRKRL